MDHMEADVILRKIGELYLKLECLKQNDLCGENQTEIDAHLVVFNDLATRALMAGLPKEKTADDDFPAPCPEIDW